jgi:nitronate monooxygenase
MQSRLLQLLGIIQPIIQAPMAGGTTPPALIAAACNAGALGCLGAGYLSPGQIAESIDAIRQLTNHPFAVNLFTYNPPSINDFSDHQINSLASAIGKYCQELHIAAPTGADATPKYNLDDQLKVLLAKKVPIFSFAFGIPTSDHMKILKDQNVILLGTATTASEARQLEAAGADAVIAQGSEAGGHRGTFGGSFESAMIGSMALIPQVVDSVKVPVIAAGGIMDGRGLAAALALGAEAVQMGTAFLLCDEANVQEGYRQAILSREAEETKITSVFSGRPARGIKNRFMEEMEASGSTLLPFPLTDAMTKPMRAEARTKGLVDYINLWAGQAGRLARPMPAAKLIELVSSEAQERLRHLVNKLDEPGS